MRTELAGALVAAAAFGFLMGAGLQLPGGSMDTFQGTRSAAAKVVGASGSKGIVGEVKVTIEPGTGEVLVATAPYVKANTQASARLAKNVAEAYTGVSLRNKDVTYSFDVSSGLVGGPSAGAAMTLATIAAIQGKEVRQNAVVTGTITRSGRIGRVGGIPVKAQAAGREGLEAFLVPEGQATRINYRPVVERERSGFFVYRDVEYRRHVFSISNYTERNFGMKTKEISTISEAAELMLKK